MEYLVVLDVQGLVGMAMISHFINYERALSEIYQPIRGQEYEIEIPSILNPNRKYWGLLRQGTIYPACIPVEILCKSFEKEPFSFTFVRYNIVSQSMNSILCGYISLKLIKMYDDT